MKKRDLTAGSTDNSKEQPLTKKHLIDKVSSRSTGEVYSNFEDDSCIEIGKSTSSTEALPEPGTVSKETIFKYTGVALTKVSIATTAGLVCYYTSQESEGRSTSSTYNPSKTDHTYKTKYFPKVTIAAEDYAMAELQITTTPYSSSVPTPTTSYQAPYTSYPTSTASYGSYPATAPSYPSSVPTPTTSYQASYGYAATSAESFSYSTTADPSAPTPSYQASYGYTAASAEAFSYSTSAESPGSYPATAPFYCSSAPTTSYQASYGSYAAASAETYSYSATKQSFSSSAPTPTTSRPASIYNPYSIPAPSDYLAIEASEPSSTPTTSTAPSSLPSSTSYSDENGSDRYSLGDCYNDGYDSN